MPYLKKALLETIGTCYPDVLNQVPELAEIPDIRPRLVKETAPGEADPEEYEGGEPGAHIPEDEEKEGEHNCYRGYTPRRR